MKGVLYLIQITREERDVIMKELPDLYIPMTGKKKKRSRKKYFLPTTKKAMAILSQLRQNSADRKGGLTGRTTKQRRNSATRRRTLH